MAFQPKTKAGNTVANARRASRAAVLVLATVVLAACSSTKDDEDFAANETPPAVLFNEGLALRSEGRLSDARKKFEEIDKQHPYSEYSKKALINLAYLNYSQGKFDEAITAAKRFTTLYPGSEDSAYALYIIGQSYNKQIPDVTRDQEMTKRSLAAFGELIQRYPESEYAEDARTKIRIAHDQLAGKEMQVGRFYLKRRQYIAAINRFKVVITEYQTTRHIEEALYRLTESYYALGVVNEAQTAAAVLGHNFPDSQWYKDAYTLLKTGGHSPSEDSGSWISRAFSGISL
ncbi:outer membrane protein assembly factor BamD [Stappia sp.]|jgi:outer membrane protein assembly factor BamD|uniref:outer membrane protein assembly factor BamD n=1 Tax=Stappia sp. TaxID=1870903 RepID=UPI003A9A4520